ncbi:MULTISPECIES: hypothetical protein [unclassified Microbacterium]|uniref:hypothetical protein n=1 Tax=unclassified Microbacterium TaxID=2609290 RepID=UPI00365ACE6C
MKLKLIRSTREVETQVPEPREEPMSAATFRGCVSMAIWLVALCIAVLTIAVVMRGWPAAEDATVQEIGTVQSGYVAIPPCGWNQVTATRPGESSVSVSSDCPSLDRTR